MSHGENGLTSHSVGKVLVGLESLRTTFFRLFPHGFLPFYLHGVLKFSKKRKQREVGRRGKRKKGDYLVVLRKLTHGLER